MRASFPRTIVAGLEGSVALNLVMVMTFRLIGFGWQGGGILLDPLYPESKADRSADQDRTITARRF